MDNLFCNGLMENDINMLLSVPKSDLHNHSTKGCKREWLAQNHPIKTLVENGVKVTINTDDLLIFDSSIENEYLKLYQAGTLSAEQLDEIRKVGLGV